MDNINKNKKKYDPEKLLEALLENDYVASEVSKHNLTKEQLLSALPILIDMARQDIEKDKYLISFYVTPSGTIKRQEVLSTIGFKKDYLSRILSQSFNPVNFELEKEYFKTEERWPLLQEFIPFLGDNYPSKGLYIYGPMGVGKTFTAKRFMKKMAESGKKVAFVNLAQLSSILKETFNDSSGKQNFIKNTLKEVDFLFIDDIGSEQITEWFRDDILFSILNYRMENHKITFFTSNHSLDELQKKQAITSKKSFRDYEKAQRLLERIRFLAKPVKLVGKNLRYK